MKVFVSGIVTETNTFSPMPTGMADFQVLRPSDLSENGELGGYGSVVDVFRRHTVERDWEFEFGLFAVAEPAGKTVRSVYESLRDEMLNALKESMPVDIVLLPLHGSMVAQGYDECETDMVARVREIVGTDAKIGVELDLHCDITQELINVADAVVIYKEYPHTDVLDRAEELFSIIADAAEGKVKPTMAIYDCKMIGMYFTPFEPMRAFVDEMIAMEGQDSILSLSLAHCFPWADVPTGGVKTLAITDDNPAKAEEVATQLGQKFFALRHQLHIESLPLDEALNKALAIEASPVVVADQSDNAGGGAPSDSTFALKALLDRGTTNVAVAMIWDPIAVKVAISAGENAILDLRLGGKMGPMSGDPLDLTVRVIGIIENMKQAWPQKEGTIEIDCGDCVALHCNGIDIIVNSIRSQVFSPQVFSKFGIEPKQRKLLVVKSIQHFYAGFAPVASEIIYMAAPGAIPPLFKEIPYQHVDMNKYPWIDNPFA